MKGYLQKVIQTKTEKVNELRKAIENGKTADEVRALCFWNYSRQKNNWQK